MNNIELVLANSVFGVEQFSKEQIEVLNEMLKSEISPEQVSIIAHPEVNELSYSILFDYLSKGNSITSQEYQKYLNIDTHRINDIIVNIYLGKLHGLSEEQINLYADKAVFNIKIARLLVENSKDASEEQVKQLVSGRFGTKTTVGKQAIQDYINGEITIDRLMIFSNIMSLDQNAYDYIKSIDNPRMFSIMKDYIDKMIRARDKYDFAPPLPPKKDELKRIKQSFNIENNVEYVGRDYNDGDCYFDSIDTYNAFRKLINDNDLWVNNALKYYNYNITNNLAIFKYKPSDSIYYGIYDEDNYLDIKWHPRSHLWDVYFEQCIIEDELSSDNNITYRDEFDTFEEYLEVYTQTKGFYTYIKAKCKYDADESELKDFIINGNYPVEFIELVKLTDNKDEKDYYINNLDGVYYRKIENIISMKQNKCSFDEIKYYIEEYIDTDIPYIFTPEGYFDQIKEDDSITETICEWLDYSRQFDDEDTFRVYRQVKQASDSECALFVIDNLQYFDCEALLENDINGEMVKFVYDNQDVFKVFYQVCKDPLLITEEYDVQEKKEIIKKLKSIFKNKPICLGCLGIYLANEYASSIQDVIIENKKYIDNIEDEDLYNAILKYYAHPSMVASYLKISNVLSNPTDIYTFLDNMEEEDVEKLQKENHKIDADVLIKFTNGNKQSMDLISDKITQSLSTVKNSIVSYFDNSSNFKPIEYDEETTYIDIIGNKLLKGAHIITFNEEDDDKYEYIFEIEHEDDTLTYSANIETKQDVKDAINKSIDLITDISEYDIYVEELQELLKTI